MTYTYKVMVRCPSGTMRLINDPLCWESVMTTFTWVNGETLESAQKIAHDLETGTRHVTAWVVAEQELCVCHQGSVCNFACDRGRCHGGCPNENKA